MSRHTNSSRRPQGRETRLMYPSSSSDRGLELSVARNDHTGAWRRREDRERGQAMVEFALILFPLLILVAGIIQFGIGLNYWLDMQRIANQGARWAAVNCTRSATTPPSYNPCNPNLQTTLRQQALTNGLQQSVCVAITFPSGTALKGDPVKVSL